MSLVSFDVGKGVEAVMTGLDGLFTSDAERRAAELAIHNALQQPHLMQAQTNLEEAKHASWFVAGWRPAVGWVCVFGLAYTVFHKLIAVLIGVPGVVLEIEAALVVNLLLALLGLGGMRTFEKMKGVSREDDPSWSRGARLS